MKGGEGIEGQRRKGPAPAPGCRAQARVEHSPRLHPGRGRDSLVRQARAGGTVPAGGRGPLHPGPSAQVGVNHQKEEGEMKNANYGRGIADLFFKKLEGDNLTDAVDT